MSERMRVQSYKGTYHVSFSDSFGPALRERLQEGDHIIVDANVLKLYEASVAPLLKTYNHTVLTPSEPQKSYRALAGVIQTLIESGFRKNNRLFAIGGGITQDVTAFVASILFRGVDWIFFPTTLLAQCDSCIGSKTSINFDEYKNQLGGFHPPRDIVIDLSFLATLPEQEIRSGMGEMLHYYLVSGEEDFQRILRDYDKASTDTTIMRELIWHSLDFKRGYVERDEFDLGPRNVFNYGHSFGHAIESLTDYKVPHGIAVSYGMDIANYLSARLGHIDEAERERIRPILKKNYAGTPLPEISVPELVNALRKDKKNVGSTIYVILTKGLGAMFKCALPINEDTKDWMGGALKRFYEEANQK